MCDFLHWHEKKAVVVFLILFVVLSHGSLNAAGWSGAGSLAVARYAHTATLLPDSRVLVAGGNGGSGPLQHAELYDAASDTWSATGGLTTNRQDHTATLLPNGRVLVAGGYGSGNFLSSAELYHPAAGSWSAAHSLAAPRRHHTATLLTDGRLLIAGGEDGNALAGTELYDPIADAWFEAGNLNTARYSHTAALLSDGRVLVAGGRDGNALAGAELYDPATGSWSATGNMTAARHGHTATLLPDGRVLVAGGRNGSTLAGAELYDPATGSWSATGSLSAARHSHTAALLPDGRVLVAGGADESSFAETEVYDPVTGTWAPAGTLGASRKNATSTLLADGRVLVAGGVDGEPLNGTELYETGCAWFLSDAQARGRFYNTATRLADGRVLFAGGYYFANLTSVDLYDPAIDAWSAAADLNLARRHHTATLLADGRVLIAGGYGEEAGFFADCEIYDPAADAWSAAGSLNVARRHHTAALLADGRVLIAGGYNSSGSLSSAELYDPATGAWSSAGSLAEGRYWHEMILLADGRVLVAGGMGSTGPLAGAELYDPATGAWSPAGSLAEGRYRHTVTLLADGRVLVAGGMGSTGPLSGAELFDPASNTWSAAAPLMTARHIHSAALLADGRVLIAGGYGDTGYLTSTELYDPAAGTWSPGADLVMTRESATATALLDGRILIAGSGWITGYTFPQNRAELYESGAGYANGWRPSMDALPSPISLTAVISLTGSGFRGAGNTEASSGGTNSSAGNFPLIQIRSGAGEQARWLQPRYFNATAYTAEPLVDFPAGPARITVFVNGIPSAAIPVVVEDPVNEKQRATVMLGGLNQTFDGTPKGVTATTSPTGLSVDLVYNGSPAPPAEAGIYLIEATIVDPVYQGSAMGIMTIGKAAASLVLDDLDHIYDGAGKQAAVTTNPPGLAVNMQYNGSSTIPVGAGIYLVEGMIMDSNYQGSAAAVMIIGKAPAAVTLDNLVHTFNGFATAAAARTTPPGLTVDLSYDGSGIPPSAPGTYVVVGNINDTNYAGAAFGILTIDPGLPLLTTSAASSVTAVAALSGGHVASDGGVPVMARGVCWNRKGLPTVLDDCVDASPGTGAFVSVLNSLEPGTQYFARAYATNSVGTAYGNQVAFSTTAVWSLSIALGGSGSGTVTSYPSGIDCGSGCKGFYQDATLVRLTAMPADNSRFIGWSGDADCEDGVVTLVGDVSCTANFYRFPWPMFLPGLTSAPLN